VGRQVGSEKRTRPVSGTAQRAAMRPEGSNVYLNYARGRQAYGFRAEIKLKSEIPANGF
jgi:hypothetical protein